MPRSVIHSYVNRFTSMFDWCMESSMHSYCCYHCLIKTLITKLVTASWNSWRNTQGPVVRKPIKPVWSICGSCKTLRVLCHHYPFIPAYAPCSGKVVRTVYSNCKYFIITRQIQGCLFRFWPQPCGGNYTSDDSDSDFSRNSKYQWWNQLDHLQILRNFCNWKYFTIFGKH